MFPPSQDSGILLVTLDSNCEIIGKTIHLKPSYPCQKPDQASIHRRLPFQWSNLNTTILDEKKIYSNISSILDSD